MGSVTDPFDCVPTIANQKIFKKFIKFIFCAIDYRCCRTVQPSMPESFTKILKFFKHKEYK